jgi:hypothetical protein
MMKCDLFGCRLSKMMLEMETWLDSEMMGLFRFKSILGRIENLMIWILKFGGFGY